MSQGPVRRQAGSLSLAVEVVSDVVCPWCYLGKRRLDAALEMTPDVDVAVGWKPFRLDPTIPPGGVTREAYLTDKFGSPEAVRPMHEQLANLGREVGIDFRFDRIERSPNTVDAHRLIRWAGAEGAEHAVVERLFFAYFTEGEDIGDVGTLGRIADEAGMDAADATARLTTDEDRMEVTAEIDRAYEIGVTGVPCFIMGQRYAVMGAQDSETLAGAFAQIAREVAAH